MKKGNTENALFQLSQCLHRLFHRRLIIKPVDIKQINILCPQLFETFGARRAARLGRRIHTPHEATRVGSRRGPQAEFGREENVAAALWVQAEPFAYELLAAAVHVGCIPKGCAEGPGMVEEGELILFGAVWGLFSIFENFHFESIGV